MNIYCNFNVRDTQLPRLLDIDMESLKTYKKVDFNLKNLNFCVLDTILDKFVIMEGG